MGIKNSRSIVTIDGPAGAGKSTVARQVARCLGWMYLDTGAMYRAVTYKALTCALDFTDEDALVALARDTVLDVKASADGFQIWVDGRDVSAEIRRPEVTNQTFHVANSAPARAIVVQWQRRIGENRAIVVEGRDTGSVVFPHAPFKFYLDADPAQRARRRWLELKARGQEVDLARLTEDIRRRDERDMARAASPLVKPVDAVVVDSSRMTPEQVAECIVEVVKSHG